MALTNFSCLQLNAPRAAGGTGAGALALARQSTTCFCSPSFVVCRLTSSWPLAAAHNTQRRAK